MRSSSRTPTPHRIERRAASRRCAASSKSFTFSAAMANLAHSIASFTSFWDTGPLRVRTGTTCCCGGGDGGAYVCTACWYTCCCGCCWGGGEYVGGADGAGGANWWWWCCCSWSCLGCCGWGSGAGGGALQFAVGVGGGGFDTAAGVGGSHVVAGSDGVTCPSEADCVNDGKSLAGGSTACGGGRVYTGAGGDGVGMDDGALGKLTPEFAKSSLSPC